VANPVLRRFFTLRVVACAPKARRRDSKFNTEFVGTSAVWTPGPDHSDSHLQARLWIFNPKFPSRRPVNGRKNQSTMKVDYTRQSCMWVAARLDLHGYTCQNAAASSLFSHIVPALNRKPNFACLERTGPET
jgi:hypothetical protein